MIEVLNCESLLNAVAVQEPVFLGSSCLVFQLRAV